MKAKAILISGLVGACIAIIIAACYKNNDYKNGTNSYEIKMQNSVFSPASLTVPINSRVTWTNNDNMVRTVTATDGSFSSGDIAVGSSYSRTFTTAGTINYFDSHNSVITGVIIVAGSSGGGGY
ncbi:MAG TPA: cupredoxin domain-containing protein [Chitinophagaceae bacterium]|nr:cupredoxin domain-containing protein [Chitinophagaceae bacterium]